VAAPKEDKIDLKSVTIDGQTFFVIDDKDEAEALVRMARNSIFIAELQRRGQKVLVIGGAVTAFLFFMSQWWPTIDAVVRAILKGVPTSG
jgi:hypothetical protein